AARLPRVSAASRRPASRASTTSRRAPRRAAGNPGTHRGARRTAGVDPGSDRPRASGACRCRCRPRRRTLQGRDQLDSGMSLVEPFLTSLDGAERSRWEAIPDLAMRLEQIVATARQEIPTVSLPDEAFARYLGERAPGGDTPWLAQLPAADLYLACACGRGDAAAVAVVEARYFPAVRAIVRGRLGAPTLADEAMQRVREHLFVGDRPHILDYAGRGALAKWLAITAVRAGLRVIRETKRETALDDDALGRIVDTSGDVAL